MKILLHSCCGPCSTAIIPVLKREGYELTGYFYNPNIHPYTENKARFLSWEKLMQEENMPYIYDRDYTLEEWLKSVAESPEERCGYCYRIRLEKAAEKAAESGMDAFTTSLLISPYQKHQLIIETAEEAAEKYNTKFYYQDFRPLFREGQQAARGKGLYMQKYCGCIYSEKERYLKY